jgi:NADH:ubiquinone oxidoreductase subunit 5 (subunit L)/multisubunit Na+/H+ antiporter MnhA subunit
MTPTVLLSTLELAVLLVGAIWALGAKSAETARKRALGATVLATAIAALEVASAFGAGPSGAPFPSWSPGVTFTTCVIGWLAVALTPLLGQNPATFARIVALIAQADLFFILKQPLALALVWGLTALTLWSELRSKLELRPLARLFAFYHAPSVVFFSIGALLLTEGHATLALVPLGAGVVLRQAAFPLHSWFPALLERAPMGVVVAFFGPALGVYAHLELLAQGLPEGLGNEAAMIAAVSAIVAGALGTVQTDARRAIAYVIMSQSNLIAFGLENHGEVARAGTFLTWQVLSLATSGLAMTLGALSVRRGSLTLLIPHGSFSKTPRMAVAFLILGFGSVGLPLTLGFVAEELLVQGSTAEHPHLGLALILATALNGINVIRCFFMLFSGRDENNGEWDLLPRERSALSLAIFLLFVGGIAPSFAIAALG